MAYISKNKSPKRIEPHNKCDHPLCEEKSKVLVNEEFAWCMKHFTKYYYKMNPQFPVVLPKEFKKIF